jgi:hypothetical protein
VSPQVPPGANDHDRADDALLTNWGGLGRNQMKYSVELLPSMDRIHGNLEHPMTEIDVDAEQTLPGWSGRREDCSGP